MSCFIKIEKGIVIEKILEERKGYIEAPDDVVCGQVQQKDGSFANPEPSKEDIAARERDEALTALEDIDRKSIRALREGNISRLAALEDEAEKLREKL